jgi:hypothetical protein
MRTTTLGAALAAAALALPVSAQAAQHEPARPRAATVKPRSDHWPMLRCPHTHTAGENIAYGYESPRALVSAWMHSEGHRANILNPHFHRIGVSGWRATNGTTYATQDFLG